MGNWMKIIEFLKLFFSFSCLGVFFLIFLIIFKWDREFIENIFKKVDKQKVKCTVHSPNK